MTIEQLIAEIERLLAELKEQAALEFPAESACWVDSTETPGTTRDVHIRFDNGSEVIGWYEYYADQWYEYDDRGDYEPVPDNKKVVAWRELK